MIRTRVGYTGGDKNDPTYHDLGNHTETLQVDYDPDVVDYSNLLTRFFQNHNPYERSISRQYMSAVFYDTSDQVTAIQQRIEELETEDRSVQTRVDSLGTFYRAEDYHQKYYLRKHPQIMDVFSEYGEDEFTDSTLATRLNGFVSGHGSRDQLERALERYGLPDTARQRLRTAANF